MVTKKPRPSCIYCARPLRRCRRGDEHIYWGAHRQIKTEADARAAVPEGSTILSVRRDAVTGIFEGEERKLLDRGRLVHRSKPQTFGDYGDGCFCGQTCGWRWGVLVAQKTPAIRKRQGLA